MNAKRTPIKKATSYDTFASQLFCKGELDSAHCFLGAHREGDAFLFRIWAPCAASIVLCGDFNDWDETSHPLHRVGTDGVWEICIDARLIRTGHVYRYHISDANGERAVADPFGTALTSAADGLPASSLGDTSAHKWRDSGWMHYREGKFTRRAVIGQPVNIYEIHPETCMRTADGDPLSCEALARELAPYVKQMGYTHVELMTAPTPHTCLPPVLPFGTPEDWMCFVDSMHEAGIGVILDWSPASVVECALGFASKLQGGKDDTNGHLCIQSLLLSSAMALTQAYHLDGIYVDTAPLLRRINAAGCARNDLTCPQYRRAAAFFKALNASLERHAPDLMVIADDTALSDTDVDGSCFSLRRDNGWTDDTLSYIKKDPLWRKYEHEKLILPLSYAFSSSYMLSISHGDVCLGKQSLLDRMPGDYAQKFANVRLLLALMMLRPGKKLLFMGCEIGSFREWSEDRPIEWFLTDHGMHAALQQYCADLNLFYLENSPLWELDTSRDGFAWIDAGNAEQSVCSFCRTDKNGNELVAVLNFTPVTREDFLLAVPADGVYEEAFNSDAQKYGGDGKQNAGIFASHPASIPYYANSIRITLPPLSALVFKRVK